MQAKLGVELLFKGFIVWSWDGNEVLNYRALNKIVVRESINYYYKYWLTRNKLQNDVTRQKKILTKWAIQSNDYAMKIGGTAKRYVQAHPMRVGNSNTKYLKSWIRSVQFMIKNNEEIASNDIRNFRFRK